MTNQLVQTMVKDLKIASTKNKAPIWAKLAVQALKPGVARKLVNITKINAVTSDNEVIVVPGKVLGTGSISHKVTLCSFGISTAAARKIKAAGGKVVTYSDLISKFPTGKGVRIIG
ncbi:MAG TPA: 50S ribosomal protein L18e [Candidatus Nitrosotenuis sp.]|jgi:large subunit ribosomal protein L18e|nr:50S ribosomal protein L18e [Candidatus Nitrosotenuis sp.]HIH46180.1 50S ribosomal protein L18e [Candidatus Nitrosotenuis sp.]HIH68862.1 50S ribosomal protein L18e [Candidatus Nitrosotenuis sp.]HII03249.1 50S ribosomal protein L18e [Candidatus Nitrosotenuis sp.]